MTAHPDGLLLASTRTAIGERLRVLLDDLDGDFATVVARPPLGGDAIRLASLSVQRPRPGRATRAVVLPVAGLTGLPRVVSRLLVLSTPHVALGPARRSCLEQAAALIAVDLAADDLAQAGDVLRTEIDRLSGRLQTARERLPMAQRAERHYLLDELLATVVPHLRLARSALARTGTAVGKADFASATEEMEAVGAGLEDLTAAFREVVTATYSTVIDSSGLQGAITRLLGVDCIAPETRGATANNVGAASAVYYLTAAFVRALGAAGTPRRARIDSCDWALRLVLDRFPGSGSAARRASSVVAEHADALGGSITVDETADGVVVTIDVPRSIDDPTIDGVPATRRETPNYLIDGVRELIELTVDVGRGRAVRRAALELLERMGAPVRVAFPDGGTGELPVQVCEVADDAAGADLVVRVVDESGATGTRSNSPDGVAEVVVARSDLGPVVGELVVPWAAEWRCRTTVRDLARLWRRWPLPAPWADRARRELDRIVVTSRELAELEVLMRLFPLRTASAPYPEAYRLLGGRGREARARLDLPSGTGSDAVVEAPIGNAGRWRMESYGSVTNEQLVRLVIAACEDIVACSGPAASAVTAGSADGSERQRAADDSALTVR